MAEDIKGKIDAKIDSIVESIKDAAEFGYQYGLNGCFRVEVNKIYNSLVNADPDWSAKKKERRDIENLNRLIPRAAVRVWREKLEPSSEALRRCLQNSRAQDLNAETGQQGSGKITTNFPPTTGRSPFDRRLDRLSYEMGIAVIPYDERFMDAGTTGFFMSTEAIKASDMETAQSQDLALAMASKQAAVAKDPLYQGVQAVANSYAIIKLYGSEGGKALVDEKGQRKWYEIDMTEDGRLAYSKNPTTTSIINWGEGDPYGRTPYHFSDFVFCKYWNLVPNNRMITLRRFPAPILDNMKFPGMDGFVGAGSAASKSADGKGNAEDATEKTQSGLGQVVKNSAAESGNEDQGTGKRVDFPPMATAVTYFGEETENQLSDILKFTTGMNWGELESDVWEVESQANPDVEAGPAGLFGGLASMAKKLNIATGNYDSNAIYNQGSLPPDPYKDGPYENRIIGPVNAITKVWRRERGLKYENKISLKFEYVARPIGGVNTKAVLLDIISNFLIIGSASAMFWGGQHRFMADPQKYPFMGGDKGIQQWYRGDPLGWGETTIHSFGEKLLGAGGLLDLGKALINDLVSGFKEGGVAGAGGEAIKGDNILSNIVKHRAADKSKGAIPYLTGLRALLIGEPVGEWHLTIGNPLNPIAMIGNLICESMEVEFGNELGPDDFPLEVKITVNLEHGMARDKDSIQSMFNRGMGRIYDLPDHISGSADYETGVDNFTGNAQTATGRSPGDWRSGTVIGGAATTGGKTGVSAVKENAMQGSVSIWNRSKFAATTPNQQNLFFNNRDIMTRSEFRSVTWVSKKSTR